MNVVVRHKWRARYKSTLLSCMLNLHETEGAGKIQLPCVRLIYLDNICSILGVDVVPGIQIFTEIISLTFAGHET